VLVRGQSTRCLLAGEEDKVAGNIGGHLDPAQAGQLQNLPTAVVDQLAGQEATLNVSSVSDME